MASRIPPSIGVEADRLEAAINQARLSVDQEIAVWSVYGDHGFAPAQHVLVAMKEAKSPMLMRQKASAPVDDFERLGRQWIEAGRTRAMAAGADKAQVLKSMQTQIAQLNTTQPHVGALTDQGTSSLKSADPLTAAFQGDLTSDMVPR